ncbi:MAG: tRNA (N(6)-L-threonylcarbamoyladenosine(37)-C(2))-methylthiotransferase [Nanoarchaeota archaeon]|nr:tRNA (N(6)-L-threonylcarbamoyladenosine(37)-C(2))-methylthiotransferase [Nanoarchaeota archaeon]
MKVFIRTYGCNFNKRDSENMKGVLENNLFEIVDTEEEADIIVVNSCGVKTVTQNKIISYIQTRDKPVYVGGCLPKMIDLTNITNVEGVFDPNTISELAEQIKEKKLKNFSAEKEHRLNEPIVTDEDGLLIVPISQGCLGNCHFCSVKYVRGRLQSYRVGDIVREITNSSSERIDLTSQDTGCYGFDIDTNLAELINQIVKIDRDFIVRVGMMSPEHVLKFMPELIESYKHPKVKKFLHLPLQSGSDKVLKEMNRPYTIEQFKYIVSEFRKAIPEIHIATDIIVCYPTETEEDFQDTVNVMEELKFEVVNLSRYAARPKTYATLNYEKELPVDVVKRRSQIIYQMIK